MIDVEGIKAELLKPHDCGPVTYRVARGPYSVSVFACGCVAINAERNWPGADWGKVSDAMCSKIMSAVERILHRLPPDGK